MNSKKSGEKGGKKLQEERYERGDEMDKKEGKKKKDRGKLQDSWEIKKKLCGFNEVVGGGNGKKRKKKGVERVYDRRQCGKGG